MKNKIVYKLTDKNMQTHNGYQWKIGEKKTASGDGGLCGPGWLHWYADPLLAVLHNPAHANFDPATMRLFRARAAGKTKHDGQLKSGSEHLALIKEMPLPKISVSARVRYAILCAQAVVKDACPMWSKWAEDYLAGKPEAQAAEAAEAAAREDSLKFSADICRKHITVEAQS